MIISLLAAAALYAGVSGEPRQAYSACLKDAVANAKTTNVPADGFKAYVHQTCAAAEDSFRKSLAAFNVKNGMGRKVATEDAQVQIDDYVFTAEDNYRFSLQASK
ncbi:MAG: hypothetical protein M3428_00455 [Pseudomonadota bacterium]|jgi:hypothetical protein|nr:hypothetical protein [Sphingomonas sp.]MDQ3470850.1 hypothetical protein [Pseudomonadota bacterium]